jgi:regulator of cell morphogenesis and NO signaling
MRKVCRVHGDKHPALAGLSDLLAKIDDDLRPHLVKEEVILFPYIEELENAQRAGRPRRPAPFGAIDNPVRMMMHEHDHVGMLLRLVRAQTNGYEAPGDACPTWRALYTGLQALEHDLFEHIHLESNLLFPRAVELERG